MDENPSDGNQTASAVVQDHMTTTRALLVLCFATLLTLASCGSEETVDAGTGGPVEDVESSEPAEEGADETLPEEQTGDAVTPDPDIPPTDGYTRLIPRDDLVSLQPRTPDEVVADPADDRRLLIRFQGAAEPCSGAAIEITESADTVTVTLQEGLDPNAAAMSCIAQVFDYEIAVVLDAPLGDREISVVG